MLEKLIQARGFTKAEVARTLQFDSRVTLYSRIESPTTLSIHEARILADLLHMPLRDVVDIACGSRETLNKWLNKPAIQ